MANKARKVSVSLENIEKARLEKGMSVNKLGKALKEKGILTTRSLRRDLSDGVMDRATIEAVALILGKSPEYIKGEDDPRNFIEYTVDGIQASHTKLFKAWLGNIPNFIFHGEIMMFPEPDKRQETVYNLTDEEAEDLQRYLIKHAGAWLTKRQIEKSRVGE